MNSQTPPSKTPPGVSRTSDIDKRAEALRENLKKRKAQSAAQKNETKDIEE